MEWLDGNKIQIIPPKRPKKLTGTRFATILGLNPWSTPFEIWCEVTRTYQKPFEDTIYTIAGKTIEPKQAEYMKQTYFMSNLVTPTDIWGKDYFRQTYGDFFRESPVLGGMWDYLLYGKDGKPTTVLEMKTSKRVEDWKDDIPEYYALQAALYAYLLGVDEVIMVASFLEPKDYDAPEKFVCSGENTITRPFKVSERYPDFEKKYVKPALKWWKDFVESGISPAFDERKDAEILKALRTNNLSPETDMAALVKEAEDLKDTMERILAHEGIPDMEKQYKVLTDMIKKAAIAQFRDGDKKVSIAGSAYNWEVSRTSTTKIDKDAMKADGILAKYTTTEDSYRISPKALKEGA
jgi:predicted phage-related endonuclease